MSAYVPPGGPPPGEHPPPPGGQLQAVPASGTTYSAVPPSSPWQPPPGAPPRGQGLAVTAIVLSGLAVLVSLLVAAWVVFVSSGAGYSALTGEVTQGEGGQVSGRDLEEAIAGLHEDAGGVVDRVACPDTVAVSADAVVTCRSVVDGLDWIEHVLFHEDGSFTLLRL